MRRLLVVLASTALIFAACGSDDADPAGVIEDMTAAYNAGDIDAVMALFSEESVVTGHPFEARSVGLSAIRAVQVEDRNSAATDNPYIISNVEATGDTVTWDHVWTRDDGGQSCKQGHTAVIQDGKILTWVWPGGGFACP
jgi:hypothetical protein